jgi:hypothetical protein
MCGAFEGEYMSKITNYMRIRECAFGVQPGDPAFKIATNFCASFEIGKKEGKDYWLEGTRTDAGEFVFNGRLFTKDKATGVVIDSFPKGDAPAGWTKRPRVDSEGYELVGSDDIVIFGYKVDGPTCHVTVNLYSAAGDIVAECLGDELRVYMGPLRFGANPPIE